MTAFARNRSGLWLPDLPRGGIYCGRGGSRRVLTVGDDSFRSAPTINTLTMPRLRKGGIVERIWNYLVTWQPGQQAVDLTGTVEYEQPMSLGNYITKVIGYSPIAYWPLNEAAGATAAVCQIDPLQNGTPTNVTFANTIGPDGVNYAPLFNGTSSWINLQTATLAAKFPAAGTEGALSIWIKVLNAGVWTDAAIRGIIWLYADGSNSLYIRKQTVNNTLVYYYEAENIEYIHLLGGQSSTGWVHLGMRWTDSGNLVEYFLNGLEIAGSQDAMVKTWAGALTLAAIGKYGIGWWSGWLAHVALFNTPVSDALMLGLGTAI